jgi:1-acyl-sn-glycerol-3-phosphate acyltransferase
MNVHPEESSTREKSVAADDQGSVYLWVRSIFRWALSGLFFFSVCPVLILLGIFIDPRKNDAPQRWLSRTSVRLAGARVEVRRSPGFDPNRTCFFVSNHVNLFDPFVVYSVVPQFMRGLELESHFRVPVYGWLMKRFGNVPVPEVNRPSDLKRMWRLTRAALDQGVSLVVFPEGGRTVTGRVGPFHDGVFRMAQDFGTPITPVSIIGAFTFNRKTSWILRPSTIVVWFHETIETGDYSRRDVPELRDKVWRAVAGPVHSATGEAPLTEPESQGAKKGLNDQMDAG